MSLIALLLALASAEDRKGSEREAHLGKVASAIMAESTKAPRPAAEWQALMLTIGIHESGFSKRIIDGRCRPQECDRGRARGAWQLHANTLNRDDWARSTGDIDLQAHLASEQLKRAYYTCLRSGVPWYVGTINAYAGRRCSAQWAGLDSRVALFRRALGAQ